MLTLYFFQLNIRFIISTSLHFVFTYFLHSIPTFFCKWRCNILVSLIALKPCRATSVQKDSQYSFKSMYSVIAAVPSSGTALGQQKCSNAAKAQPSVLSFSRLSTRGRQSADCALESSLLYRVCVSHKTLCLLWQKSNLRKQMNMVNSIENIHIHT